MTFKDYQKLAKRTMKKGNNSKKEIIVRMTLGLVGESGEVAEKVKKWMRGDIPFSILRNKIANELGDVLWYLSILCSAKYGFNLDLDSIAEENIKKLQDRQKRNKLKGNGDNR